MIAGTIVMEDTILHFHHNQQGQVILTVCDALTGNKASKTVSAEDFGMAIGVAMHPEGSSEHMSDEEYNALVEAVTPVYFDYFNIEGEEVAQIKLRWLP